MTQDSPLTGNAILDKSLFECTLIKQIITTQLVVRLPGRITFLSTFNGAYDSRANSCESVHVPQTCALN